MQRPPLVVPDVIDDEPQPEVQVTVTNLPADITASASLVPPPLSTWWSVEVGY